MRTEKIVFFCSALVLPKIKFKILRFSEKFLLKKKINITTFWKSIARTSNDLSSMFWMRLSTLKKIKARTLLLDFIWNFLTSNFWCTFSYLDVWEDIYSEFVWMWKKIFEIENNFSIATTLLASNKIVNRIFWDFLFPCRNISKSSYFFEKYFLCEWSAWTVGLSKTLKYFVIRFFCFYIPDFFLMKKNILLSAAPWFTNFVAKTLTAWDIFKGKRYFIFPKFDGKFFVWLNFLQELTKTLDVFEIIYFIDGYVFLKGSQRKLLFSNFWLRWINMDLSLLNFFFLSDWSFLTNAFFF